MEPVLIQEGKYLAKLSRNIAIVMRNEMLKWWESFVAKVFGNVDKAVFQISIKSFMLPKNQKPQELLACK